jgi:hypothetical protein
MALLNDAKKGYGCLYRKEKAETFKSAFPQKEAALIGHSQMRQEREFETRPWRYNLSRKITAR